MCVVVWCGGLMEFEFVDSMLKPTELAILCVGIFITIGIVGNMAQSNVQKKKDWV